MAELKQRLAAILAADAAGYSRLMAADEHATVAALDAARSVFRSHIEANQGRIVDMAGDSVLAVFETAGGAATAALAVQGEIDGAPGGAADDRRMRFRIGVHLGDVIEKADGTVYGDGVNIAARLQALSEPGGVTVSDAVKSALRGKVQASFEDQGEQSVKNIPEPVHAFRVTFEPTQAKAAAVVTESGIDVSKPVPGFGGRPAIAVLPFANMSDEKEQEYFADGLAEDILTRLAMWRWVPVIARNSSFTYRGRAVDVKEVGRALGARYVLEGSVRKAGNRVRVTAQLIDAESGHHVWAERYDRLLEDLFALQDELTDGIVAALESAVGRAETERARLKSPSSLNAWETFQRGWWHVGRMTREDYALAIPLLQRAADLDPGFSQPLTGIALVRMSEAYLLWVPKPAEALSESTKYAQLALAVDVVDPLAHAVLGYLLSFTHNPDKALAPASRSIELNPSFAMGYHSRAFAFVLMGRLDSGVRDCETAIRLTPNDPGMPTFLTTLSVAQYGLQNYDEAASVAELAVQSGPHNPLAWRAYACALGQLERRNEAERAVAQMMALIPDFKSEAVARAMIGFTDETLFQRFLEGLRKAGWQG